MPDFTVRGSSDSFDDYPESGDPSFSQEDLKQRLKKAGPSLVNAAREELKSRGVEPTLANLNAVVDILKATAEMQNESIQQANDAKKAVAAFLNTSTSGANLRSKKALDQADVDAIDYMGKNLDVSATDAANANLGYISGASESSSELEEQIIEMMSEGMESLLGPLSEQTFEAAQDVLESFFNSALDESAFDFDYFRDFDPAKVFDAAFYETLGNSKSKEALQSLAEVQKSFNEQLSEVASELLSKQEEDGELTKDLLEYKDSLRPNVEKIAEQIEKLYLNAEEDKEVIIAKLVATAKKALEIEDLDQSVNFERLFNRLKPEDMKPEADQSDLFDDFYNDVFDSAGSPPRRTTSGAASSGGSPDGIEGQINDLKFSAVESLASQVLSRTMGTSYYPILTALRTARKAYKLDSGQDIGLVDLLKFGNQSFNEVTGQTPSFKNIFGFGSNKQPDSNEPVPVDISDESSENLSEDIVNNVFGGGNGNEPPGDGSGIQFMDDDDDGEKEPGTAEIIAALGLATALSVSAVDALKTFGRGVASAGSDVIGTGVDMLGSSMTSTPDMTAVQSFGNVAKAGGEAIGSAGGTIGMAIGRMTPLGPLGAIIGKQVGEALGAVYSATVGTAIDILQSIDAGMKDLGKSLAPFSGQLTQANVQADIENLYSQMNQAQELGDILADNVTARNDFMMKLREVGTGLIKALGPLINDLTEAGTGLLAILETLMPLLDIFVGAYTALMNNQIPWLKPIVLLLQTIAANTKQNTFPDHLQEIEDFLNPETNRQAFDPGLMGGGGGLRPQPLVPGITL